MGTGHVQLVESEQGVLGEGVGRDTDRPNGVGPDQGRIDTSDPKSIRAGAIEAALDAAVESLNSARRSLDYLAVVDRDAAEKKEWVLKGISELVDHLDTKT